MVYSCYNQARTDCIIMALSTSLFKQPMHIVTQKSRIVPLNGTVCLAKRQDRTMPLNTVAQKAGVRYENRVGKYLQQITVEYDCELHSHVWFDIGNSTLDQLMYGPYKSRTAQIDFFLVFPSKAVILFEVKQTWVDTSSQLAFYKYLLNGIGLTPVTCCTICKNLTPKTPRDNIIRTFEDIKENAVWQIRI